MATTLTWDLASPPAQVLATSDGAAYVHGVDLVAERRSGAWAYPLGDALGSVRQWTDEDGYVNYAGGYTPFGTQMWTEASYSSYWGYTGEWWNASVGMVYLRARWLDVETGRFISQDPIMPNYQNPQSINLYAYVLNSPINHVDPSGYIPQPPPLGPLPYDITTFELGWCWLTEQCPDSVVLDEGYDLTQDLMDDQGVNQARTQFYRRLSAGALKNNTDDHYGYRYTVIPYVGAAAEYLTGHDRIGFFLGSYSVDSHLNPDSTVLITVRDSKNWQSGTRSPFYYLPDLLGPIINPCLPEPYRLHRSRHSLEGLIMEQYPLDFPSDMFLASVLENRRRSDPGFFESDVRIGGRMELMFIWTERLQTR